MKTTKLMLAALFVCTLSVKTLSPNCNSANISAHCLMVTGVTAQDVIKYLSCNGHRVMTYPVFHDVENTWTCYTQHDGHTWFVTVFVEEDSIVGFEESQVG